MLSRWLGRQLRQPSGWGGRLVGWSMNRSNAAMNRRAIELLDVRPAHAVLEVGFGGGLALAPLLTRAWSGRVTGIDPSDDMLATASLQHADAVAAGRLRLEHGMVESLPHPDDAFDRALSVNTLYFWGDPARGFSEIRRVLHPGGLMVLGYRPAARLRDIGFTRHGFRLYEDEEVLRLVGDAGFEVLVMERGLDGLGHVNVVASATK
jgi:ubiquinone/menaquinone biosynthesis C-methylase UbiE